MSAKHGQIKRLYLKKGKKRTEKRQRTTGEINYQYICAGIIASFFAYNPS